MGLLELVAAAEGDKSPCHGGRLASPRIFSCSDHSDGVIREVGFTAWGDGGM